MRGRLTGRFAAIAPWLMGGALLLGCGGNDKQTKAKSADARLPPAPKRTAADSHDLRLMAAELFAGQGCQRLENRFRPLGGGKGDEAQATGTLIPFQVDVELEAELDMDYETDSHLFMAWLTPVSEPNVQFALLGDVAVDKKGFWSEVVAAAATVFMTSPDQRADVQVAAKGERLRTARWQEG